jgi:hypothetical protein
MFKFTLSIPVQELENHKFVKKATFDISRYGEYTKTISFETPKVRYEAILAVEEYLSEPLTWQEYDQIKEDLIEDNLTEDTYSQVYEIRGNCLGDKTFLEIATIKGDTLILRCGS